MITVSNVSKGYSKKSAVSNLSFTVNPGEIHGLIGENSAGKTTIIKCMTGIYKPDDGSITLDGKDVFDNMDAKKRIAYIADTPAFVPFYTVKQVVKMYKSLYEKFSIDRFSKYNEIFKIPMKSVAMSLSKGQKMRLQIMLELSKGAEYIIMDEPSSGLDPVARNQFFELVVKEVEENSTGIFISSHNLDGLEKICDTVTVLNHGRIENNMTIDDAKSSFYKINAVFEKGAPDELYKIPEIIDIKNTGRIYSMVTKMPENEIKEILTSLGAGFSETLDLSLEEYFIALDLYYKNEDDSKSE